MSWSPWLKFFSCSICKELTRFFIKFTKQWKRQQQHSQRAESKNIERNKDMNLCCTRTVHHISKQSLIGLFIEAGGKTHFMDSNKPLSLLNTQINYRLGNQNSNLFSPPVSTDPQFCFGLWQTKEPLSRSFISESRYKRIGYYDKKMFFLIELNPFCPFI